MYELSVNIVLLFGVLVTCYSLSVRTKPVLTQQWVNDAAYFDGTGYAEVTLKEDTGKMQRFEQEVKLMSHNGILLMLLSQVRGYTTTAAGIY